MARPLQHEGDLVDLAQGRDAREDLLEGRQRGQAYVAAVTKVWRQAIDRLGARPQDWSPDDSKLAVLEEISVNETYLWVADVATGTKTLVTPKSGSRRNGWRR